MRLLVLNLTCLKHLKVMGLALGVGAGLLEVLVKGGGSGRFVACVSPMDILKHCRGDGIILYITLVVSFAFPSSHFAIPERWIKRWRTLSNSHGRRVGRLAFRDMPFLLPRLRTEILKEDSPTPGMPFRLGRSTSPAAFAAP